MSRKPVRDARLRRYLGSRTALGGPAARLVAAGLAAAALAGCGLDVKAPDLFLVTRTGSGKPLTMLVNDGGTITCDGARAKTLPDKLLLVARDLAVQLVPDAQSKLDLPSPRGSVYRYNVRLQQGTIAFSDTDGLHHPTLAELEQFVVQAQPSCGVAG
jgi:hypothetical protein